MCTTDNWYEVMIITIITVTIMIIIITKRYWCHCHYHVPHSPFPLLILRCVL